MTEPVEAILFDMGGTLWHSTKRDFAEKAKIVGQIIEIIGAPTSPEALTETLLARAQAYHQWSEQTLVELTETEMWVRWLLPDYPMEQIASLAMRLNAIWREAKATRRLFPETPDTIRTLYQRGYRLGLVSNTTSSTEAPLVLARAGLAGYFDTFILSCQVGMRKPGAGILLEATRRMNVRPEHCVYVGNLPHRDVLAARNAGFHSAILLRDPSKPLDPTLAPALMPDHFLDNLKELLEIFPARSAQGEKDLRV